MLGNRIAKKLFCVLVSAGCLATSMPASADIWANLNAWVQKEEKRIDLNLYQLGKEVELGRECGLTDATMPEHMEDYRALLAANDAALKSKTISAEERETLSPLPQAQEAFEEGVKATKRVHFLSDSIGCPKLMVDWKKQSLERAEQAKHWRAIAAQYGEKNKA